VSGLVGANQALATMLFTAAMFGAAVGSAAVILYRQLVSPPRGSEWLRAEIQRAAASCNDAVTVRHLRAIVTALR
jgi:hypothetical protein